MNSTAILILESAENWRQIITAGLLQHGFKVIQAFHSRAIPQLVSDHRVGVIVLGPSIIDSGYSLEMARQIRQSVRTTPLLLIVTESSEALAVAALRAGINDYVKGPCSSDELMAAVQRCLSLNESKPGVPRDAVSKPIDEVQMVGQSAAILRVKAYLTKVAPTDLNVLITGETGTGKEVAAKLIHSNSKRREKALITINCAAVPENLFETELFGFERGSFTGADRAQEGRLKAADGGTVFLDEIGDLSANTQAKILRVIENREMDRVGGKTAVPLNVRFIAATNQDLEELVNEGKFRKDLFFRLNVARTHLPPLRDRREDVPLLVTHYLQVLNTRLGTNVSRLTGETLEHLLAYDWPGNIRELKHLLEAIFVDLSSAEISMDALPLEFRARSSKMKTLPRDERERLLCALVSTNWNKSRAADRLQWSRMTLYRKLARYQLAKTSHGTTT